MKKGFTLIELLAVIIILAIIALVATPIILDVVNDARKSAAISEAKMIYSGINNYCVEAKLEEQLTGKTNICKDGVTVEEIDQMVNLGNAKVTKITYDNKVTELVVESNNQIIELKPDGSFTINGEVAGGDPVTPPVNSDSSGANKPELLAGLTPIKYDGNKWIVADKTQDNWYNYSNKEWANAVVLNKTKTAGQEVSESDIDLWYVWIPRYKYQILDFGSSGIESQRLNIEFEKGTATTGTTRCTAVNFKTNPTSTVSETCTNSSTGNWYTHPAFTFGDKELSGFWAGKFEISTTDNTCNNTPSMDNCNKVMNASQIKTKPNTINWRYATVSTFFNSVQNLSNTNVDAHMVKNNEWAAILYLANSTYGIGNNNIYINNSGNKTNYISYTGRSAGGIGSSIKKVSVQFPSSGSTSTDSYYNYGYYTYDGKIVNYDGTIGDFATDRTLGTKASTTGNIYGVYDMNGGSSEYVMANIVDANGNFRKFYDDFSTVPDSRYYDSYAYDLIYLTKAHGKLGDATKENSKFSSNANNGMWFGDWAVAPDDPYPWFSRGGIFSGGNALRVDMMFGGENAGATSRIILTGK